MTSQNLWQAGGLQNGADGHPVGFNFKDDSGRVVYTLSFDSLADLDIVSTNGHLTVRPEYRSMGLGSPFVITHRTFMLLMRGWDDYRSRAH